VFHTPKTLLAGVTLVPFDAPAPKVVVCSAEMDGKNKLHFGDNLRILRDHFAEARFDLIYLDPPYNYNATHNRLFKDKRGEAIGVPVESALSHDGGRPCG